MIDDKAAGGLDSNWSGTPEVDRDKERSEEPATRRLADVPSSGERPSKRKEKGWGATHNEKHREAARDEETDVGLREL